MMKVLITKHQLQFVVRHKYTYTKIRDLKGASVGDKIQVKGWVNNFRKQSKFYFVDLKDGSTNDELQVIVDRDLKKKNTDFGYGASIIASGVIGIAPRGHMELRAEQLQLVGKCPVADGVYPFARKQVHSEEYIRQHLHLRTHNKQFEAIFRARHLSSNAFHKYFDDQGFLFIQTPILTTNSCEGAGELFSVVPLNESLLTSMQNKNSPKPKDEIYFDRKTFLTVSGQMHLEAMCSRLGSVYSFGPVFRAENSISTIHMCEFYMIEVEESFVECVDDITKRIESTIKTVTTHLLNRNSKEIQEAYETSTATEHRVVDDERFSWLRKDFPTISYAEATEILQKYHFDFNLAEGLSKVHELFLVKHLQSPVFVINWPRALKPFYMRSCKHDSQQVEAVDFLMPLVGELAGGSVRENNVDNLKKTIPPDLKWYLDLRTYGGCTTGGFGIGFDRYLQVLLGIANIKDTIPFPRWPHHCRT